MCCNIYYKTVVNESNVRARRRFLVSYGVIYLKSFLI